MNDEQQKLEIINEQFHEIESLDNDQFLKVRETLTRIGLAGKREEHEGRMKPILWQSCHLFHKRGRYFIVHFKELFQLDGKCDYESISQEDFDRVEYVVSLLSEWNMIRPFRPCQKPRVSLLVIPFSEKDNWKCKQKYTIGSRKPESPQTQYRVKGPNEL